MKRTDVFGLPVYVGTHDELAEAARTSPTPAYYVVARCTTLSAQYIPAHLRRRNLRTPCEKCGEICWYDPLNYVPHTTIVCDVCFIANDLAGDRYAVARQPDDDD